MKRDELEELTAALMCIVEANAGTQLDLQDDWKFDAEQLAKKIVSHALTTLDLLDGTKPQVPGVMTQVNFIDYISIFNVVRSALETFWTLNHVFTRPGISDQTRDFRRKLWHAASLSNRQRLTPLTNLIQTQLQHEAGDLANMRTELSGSPLFGIAENISGDARDRITRGIGHFDWKPDSGWRTIAMGAGWSENYFADIYNHLSAVCHSDATVSWQLSNTDRDMQIKQASLAVDVLIVALSFFIRDYAKILPSGNAWLSTKPHIAQLVDVNIYIATNYLPSVA